MNIIKIIIMEYLMNASGCYCVTEEELDQLNNSEIDIVVSKSSTLESRNGNSEPRWHMNQYGSINSMGIPNKGYQFYLNYSSKSKKAFIHSIFPFSPEELTKMLDHIISKKKDYTIELNLSCPNLVNRDVNSNDLETYLQIIDRKEYHNINFGLKLQPFYHQYEFDRFSNLIKRYKCLKFITCCNSVIGGLIINPEKETTCIYPKNGLGGIGGLYCKPVCLANVYNFYLRLRNENIEIYGCGGISTGWDVFEYILCGASKVQIGTQLVREGPECFKRIKCELIEIMNKKGYKSIEDFRGRIKLIEHS